MSEKVPHWALASLRSLQRRVGNLERAAEQGAGVKSTPKPLCLAKAIPATSSLRADAAEFRPSSGEDSIKLNEIVLSEGDSERGSAVPSESGSPLHMWYAGAEVILESRAPSVFGLEETLQEAEALVSSLRGGGAEGGLSSVGGEIDDLNSFDSREAEVEGHGSCELLGTPSVSESDDKLLEAIEQQNTDKILELVRGGGSCYDTFMRIGPFIASDMDAQISTLQKLIREQTESVRDATKVTCELVQQCSRLHENSTGKAKQAAVKQMNEAERVAADAIDIRGRAEVELADHKRRLLTILRLRHVLRENLAGAIVDLNSID